MSYDALAESIILIRTRQPPRVLHLSRRRRFAAMAVDVAGDAATTMFLRRSAGCDIQESWVLASRHDEWRLLGGGGGTVDHNAGLLADRPETIRDDMIRPWSTLPGVDPRLVTVGSGAGGVHYMRGGRDLFPRSGRWISYATLFASAQVGAIQVADRTVAVPWHGHTQIAWIGRRPPRIGILGRAGQLLATTRIPIAQP